MPQRFRGVLAVNRHLDAEAMKVEAAMRGEATATAGWRSEGYERRGDTGGTRM